MKPRNEDAADKIRDCRADYDNRPSNSNTLCLSCLLLVPLTVFPVRTLWKELNFDDHATLASRAAYGPINMVKRVCDFIYPCKRGLGFSVFLKWLYVAVKNSLFFGLPQSPGRFPTLFAVRH